MTQKTDYPPLGAFFFRDFKNSYVSDILEEIYLKNIYKPFLTGRKNQIIVDIGQNIGLFSHYVSPFASRVIGLEPAPMHRDTCKTMLDYNKITNVEILPYAVANKNEKRKFYLTKNNTAFSLTKLEPESKEVEVECITMDKLFTLAKIDHIDLLKIDPEGEEARILASDGFKKVASKIKVIVGEFHNWCGVNQIQFKDLLEEAGYEFHWLPNMKAACFTAIRYD